MPHVMVDVSLIRGLKCVISNSILQTLQVPKQNDSYNCGAYVCMFHEWITKTTLRFTQSDIEENLASQTTSLHLFIQDNLSTFRKCFREWIRK
jgi:Ulp1 family protease